LDACTGKQIPPWCTLTSACISSEGKAMWGVEVLQDEEALPCRFPTSGASSLSSRLHTEQEETIPARFLNKSGCDSTVSKISCRTRGLSSSSPSRAKSLSSN